MAVKSILVLTNAMNSDHATLDLALAVGRLADAHLSALFVRQDVRESLRFSPDADTFSIERIVAGLDEESAAGAERARGLFDAWCLGNGVPVLDRPSGSGGVSAEWHDAVGAPDQVIARFGSLADLIVETGLHERQLPLEKSTIEGSLFGAGRPVLVCPAALPERPFKTALVAWNGSREANRAVVGALDLLAACEEILVFTRAESGRPAHDPDEVIDNLAWRGLTARAVTGASPSAAVGADLLDTARREGASLLVTGAFTHSRFRQAVLGGVTNHVLHHAKIPALLVH
ncbi:MAG TPA: universal stress protein [Candidatus Sulfotelmatobacter sp.]|nr:universal stress protein [Candidatus Sulfotelmatobacter sp.]